MKFDHVFLKFSKSKRNSINETQFHENDRVWQRKYLCGGGDEERGLDEEEGDGKEKGKEKSGKRATRSRAAAAAAKKKKTG